MSSLRVDVATGSGPKVRGLRMSATGDGVGRAVFLAIATRGVWKGVESDMSRLQEDLEVKFDAVAGRFRRRGVPTGLAGSDAASSPGVGLVGGAGGQALRGESRSPAAWASATGKSSIAS
jgi:hypothetical protein